MDTGVTERPVRKPAAKTADYWANTTTAPLEVLRSFFEPWAFSLTASQLGSLDKVVAARTSMPTPPSSLPRSSLPRSSLAAPSSDDGTSDLLRSFEPRATIALDELSEAIANLRVMAKASEEAAVPLVATVADVADVTAGAVGVGVGVADVEGETVVKWRTVTWEEKSLRAKLGAYWVASANLEKRDGEVEGREIAVEEREELVGISEAAVGKRESAVEGRESAVEGRETAADAREAEQRTMDAQLRARERALQTKDRAVSAREREVAAKEAVRVMPPRTTRSARGVGG